jgi:hypothetical protein
MKQVAMQVGDTTKFSSTQAAKGLDILAAAGFSANDAMKTLPSVTLAAQAANEDLGLTAETTAKAMNAFNIPVEKAAHVADVFSQAANTTALDMQGLKDALGQVGEVGPRFNQTLEDTVAVVGRLVDMGVPAASAGTAVRQALTSLSAPTMQASNLIHDLGLNLRDADGHMRPIPDLVKELSDSLAAGNPGMEKYRATIGLSDKALQSWAKENGVTFRQAKQIQTAITQGGQAFTDYANKTLFGVEGAKAFSLAMSDGKPLIIDTATETEKLNQLTEGLATTMGIKAARAFVAAHTAQGKFTASGADAIKSVSALGVASDGTAARIGALFQATTAQKIDNFQGAVSNLAITLVQDLKPGLDSNIDSLTHFVTGLREAAADHPGLTKIILAFLGIAAAVGPTLFIFAKVVAAVRGVATAFVAIKGAAQTAIAWTQLYGAAAAKAGKAGAGGMLSRLGGVANFLTGPWGIAIGAGIAVLVGFALKEREAAKAAKEFTSNLTFQNGTLDDNSRSLLAHQLATEGTLAAALKAGVSEQAYTSALLEGGDVRKNMIADLEATAEAHTRLVQGFGTATQVTDETGKAASRAAEQLKAMGAGLDQSATAAGQADAALGGVKDAASGTAGAVSSATSAFYGYKSAQDATTGIQKKLTDSSNELKTTSGQLAAAIQQVVNKFTILKHGSLDAQAANDAYKQSLLDAKSALASGNRSLSDNTKKGLQNRAALRSMISALNDKITANYKDGLTSKNATKKGAEAAAQLKRGRKAIIDSMVAAGLNRKAVTKMVDQMLKTPSQLKTDVKVPGLDKANEKIKLLRERIRALKDKLTKINFSTNADTVYAKILGKTRTTRNQRKSQLPGDPQVRAAGGAIVQTHTRMAHYKAGGRVQNFSGKAGRSYDTEPAMLRVDEHVWTPEEVKGAGGHSKVEQLRDAAKHGALSLARGGAVNHGRLNDGPGNRGHNENRTLTERTQALPKSMFEIVPAAERRMNSISQAFAVAASKAGQANMQRLLDKKNAEAAGGPIGKAGFVKALNYAKAHEGHPYVFGTLWDCSGFMSSLNAIIHGQAPHREFSTPDFHGAHAKGFTRGKRSPFMIGVNPSPGKFGHMAGTLNGVNVESAGGVGVRVGKNARGHNAGMFSWHGGLARGGAFRKPKGDPPFDTVDPRGQRYDPVVARMFKEMYGYKNGTGSTMHGTHLFGERGPELARVGSNTDVMTSRKTLDYLSRIEAFTANPPPSPLAAGHSPARQTADAAPVENVTIQQQIHYAKDKEVTTMAAQRSIVSAGRGLASRRRRGR